MSDDLRGSEEIARLAEVFMRELRRIVPDLDKYPEAPLIRVAYLEYVLVNAYAKGVEIGAEYARRETPQQGKDT
jgi:hypothetical protein